MWRGIWRLLRAVLLGVQGILIVLLRFPSLDQAGRQARIQWWSASMLRCLGMGLEVRGRFRPGGTLLVANHISWIDIMAIHAVCPRARFVSKADVQDWPLVNQLVDCAGTLYVRREQRRDAMRVMHEMAQALKDGHCVAVFPEGTTGDGRALLPFHANLLQAAIAVQAPVQPVALRYRDRDHAISPAVEFLGETTLAQSLWRIACGRGLVVTVTALDSRGSAHADRRSLAAVLRSDLATALGQALDEAPSPPDQARLPSDGAASPRPG
ncbi:MAG: 1-acyl-sn-glycerol-3-phosphate acyltransferase [Betaproteobacteria bacterium]|nr:1-acyl-sn-glycerol-3-phosphate acyltransferase [Betaproteobacteria bacterium]NBT09401.1 1-acyl-sn-glycerol-3-phosphate acyltransferase [Betaproteobacteria bacterium]NBU49437.1 1-acyl-sn-glycerol-3-phosphate acyltransferase [Betaproteobacteria bacterium]NBX96503.1 1-acyl-sn-glycerol-3-phosphate acyltransferase [Betaproteobacteria bacterium]